jgi:hypothetical protein
MSTNPYEPPQFAQGPVLGGPSVEFARAKVQTPAMALMIFAIVFGILQLLGLLANVLGVSLLAAGQAQNAEPGQAAFALGQGVVGVVASIIGIIVSGVIVYGAQRMKKLESRGLAMASAVLAALPCISPCCIVGLPIGIWAITVLNDPQVKAVYH